MRAMFTNKPRRYARKCELFLFIPHFCTFVVVRVCVCVYVKLNTNTVLTNVNTSLNVFNHTNFIHVAHSCIQIGLF